MFKYASFVLIFSLCSVAFSADVMVNLTKNQAEKAMSFLQGQKAVLIRNENLFSYIRVHSLEIKNGVAKTSTLNKFSILHQDGDDYHLEVNGRAIDLEKIYLRHKKNISKWVRLGSIVDYNFYRNRVNETFFIFKSSEKIPVSLKKKLSFVGSIKTPKTSGNSSMTLEEESDDAEFNNAEVFKPLRKVN